ELLGRARRCAGGPCRTNSPSCRGASRRGTETGRCTGCGRWHLAASDEPAPSRVARGGRDLRRTAGRGRAGAGVPVETRLHRGAPGMVGPTEGRVGKPARILQEARGGEEAMTDVQSVSAEVEVAVDPDTAFRVFTEEMDLWWVRGPINFFSDGHRVVEVRCETGVGGRLMEVRDSPDSDDVFVRARITAWEPPTRLCWDSEQDDVATEV